MGIIGRVGRIEKLFTEAKEPPYRIKQLFGDIYHRYIKRYSQMLSLPESLRKALINEFGDSVLCLENIGEQKDGQADKVLFETQDKNRIEAVLMTFKPNEERDGSHRSICVSSQCGCAFGCTFCATGAIGFKKNLTPDEITDQILYFLQQGQPIDSVSFMGMGEPFANPNFFDALKIITDKNKMAFSQKKLNVSTVGIIPGIRRLQEEFPSVNLAFSLHTPFPKQREELMPITKTYPIDLVMEALNKFIAKTNKRVFIAYVLIRGVTDTTEHARELAKLIKKQGEKHYLYHVNLIRFNSGTMSGTYKESTAQSVRAFQKTLNLCEIKNTLRQSFGVKIDAACGQLYGTYKKR